MRRLLCSLLLGGLCLGVARAQHLPLPAPTIPLSSPEGQQLLLTSHARTAYWPLSIDYTTELGMANCGPASAVMVLNALNVPAPISPTHEPFHQWDQENFFTPETEKVLTRFKLNHMGATLEELGAMIRTHGVEVEVHHAADGGIGEFRRRAKEAVSSQHEFVIANFDRAKFPQEGGTHFSPLGAYNEKTDRFLVMDVARFHYPPWWLPADRLFRGMNTFDSTGGKNRGYLIVKTK